MNIRDAAPTLVGRSAERARLERLLLTAAAGHSAVLVLRGPAGVGKTALLEDTAAAGGDHRVVRLRCVPAEADLPYSALHLLCSALARELDLLAPHQRDALETAVGLRDGDPPDRFLTGVATAALLTLGAADRPVLCVVDDTQWLDEASAHAFVFAARRLGAAPVALLLAGGGHAFDGLPVLEVDGLGDADAHRLLRSALAVPLDRSVVERIVAESGGNPRALLDAVRGVTPADLAGGYRVPPAVGADDAVLAGLAADSRLLLLLAAADPLGDPIRLWRASARLGIDARAAERLDSAELLSFGVRVTFRDPRMRSVVYGLASAADLRAVHGALAAATDPVDEPDRRVWHLALAATAPDGALGDELARRAATAQERGGLPAAAAFLERSTQLTPDPMLRTERAIAAAALHHEAGAGDAAARLLAGADVGPLDEPLRARLDRLRARIGFHASRGRATVEPLLESALRLEPCHPALARQTYLDALGALVHAGHLGATDAVAAVRARTAGQRGRDTDPLSDGLTLRCAEGYPAAVEPLKLALKSLRSDTGDVTPSRLPACLVAPDLWDDDAWQALTDAEVARARACGALATLPYALTHAALVAVHTGRFAAARSLVAEADTITESTLAPPFTHAAVVLAAWRAAEDTAVGVLDDARRDAYDRGEGIAVTLTDYAASVLYNGLGRYPDAVAAALRATDSDTPAVTGWSLVELVEAAVRCGEPGTAAIAVDRLSERTCLSGTDWALGVEATSRALLHDGQAAEDLYVEAIDRLGRCRITTHLARARLVYGEWLRREGRRVAAREPLRAAHQAFTVMGAAGFAERAHRELLATGERVRRRVAGASSQLTPQEVRIAALARDGRSNPEIATQLSISPRTVEYHLHKVFAKLAITSRTELHLVLAAGTA